ncbi:hypothetical protein MJO28_007014 [Puccinia striiformis f. sp. tritici]|uniref:Uncharacterized protein n=1 Tax=Puccinia striiformis f. sp. tritici TaxID=168172 RepID=A0ACC0ED95_9BASI|nr:hypothetical protein MJO28_007014 [Puccinia striiformis f. sp. tritici]
MERAGQAALSDALNTEEHLLNTVLRQGTHRLKACDMVCRGCNTLHWPEERSVEDTRKNNNIFSICCQKGKVTIPSGSSLAPNTPKILKDLLVGKSTGQRNFQRLIRTYNNSVAFTSLGFQFSDGPREVSRGPVFTLQGALVHKIGPIAPAVNRRPAFAQMFVVGQGGLAEARERLEVALGKVPTKDAKANMDTTIILDIQKWLYKYNPYAKLYKQAAAWRLLQFDLSARSPAVQRLSLHDPKRALLLAKLVDPESTPEQKAKASRTTLNQFFQLNVDGTQGLFKNAQDCYYHEIPNHFAWDKTTNRWVPRTKVLTTVGRIYFASLHQGERYYIRLLLLHRKDVRSFEHLRTVGGVMLPDFRAAADESGLLLNDKQYDQALTEGAVFKTGFQLRLMFCIILVHSPPAAPHKLFQDHWRNLGDDVGHILEERHNLPNANEDQKRAFTLYLVDQVLRTMGSNLGLVAMQLNAVDQGLMKSIDLITTAGDNEEPNRILRLKTNVGMLNEGQRLFYNAFVDLMKDSSNKPFSVYLDGPGGTGKTFILNTIIDFLRVNRRQVVVVATTGVAALLLDGGQTAHSALKIPIKAAEDSECGFSKMDMVGRRLAAAEIILWDEAVSSHRHSIEAVNKSLQALMDDKRPFVVKDGAYPKSEHATLKSSFLWSSIKSFSLKDNMRLSLGLQSASGKENQDFARNILAIREGLTQH